MQEFTDLLAEMVQEGNVASHLQGMVRSTLMAERQIRDQGMQLGAFEGAVEFTAKRLDLSATEIEAIAASYGPNALSIAGETGAAIEGRLAVTTNRIVAESVTRTEAVALIRADFVAAGIHPANPYIFRQIFETQVSLAYSAGRGQLQRDPAVAPLIWGYEYVTIGDDRVRPNHAALDGTTLPKDDPAWAAITPPNGWRCRCERFEIFEPEPVVPVPGITEIDEQLVVPGPDPGWAFDPGLVFGAA